uniref:Uncharacterized protein n=1 Tax=Ditylenchus dipsaci TaxID=166011 RepID=A0A915CSS2_9BILA
MNIDGSSLTPEQLQKERVEYVKNIGIEYRFGCYKEKKPESCYLLGEYMEAVERNYKESLKLFKENCEERQDGKSCFKYASYLRAGRECEPSLEKMIEPLETACDQRIAPACRLLGLIHWNKKDAQEQDLATAVKYVKKACDLGDGQACGNLCGWYLGPDAVFQKPGKNASQGNTRTLEKNLVKSLKYGIKGCDAYYYPACVNVARMYMIGEGVAKDPDKAKEYKEKAKQIYDISQSLKRK